MKWNLKKSKSASGDNLAVIKITQNNLFGDFMKINDLGNNQFDFTPTPTAIYRIKSNVDTSKKAIRGCKLVYQNKDESFPRYLSMSDEEVRELSNEEINDKEFLNNFAIKKFNSYQ